MDELKLTDEERRVLLQFFIYGRDNWYTKVKVGDCPPAMREDLSKVMNHERFNQILCGLGERLIEIKNITWDTTATNTEWAEAYIKMLSVGEN